MNNQSYQLPKAIYGKSGQEKSIPEGLHWHQIDPSFPDYALKAADECVRGFQWFSKAGSEIYDDVIMWIPLTHLNHESILLIFKDTGQDVKGRPHTLRVDAFFVGSFAYDLDENIHLILMIIGKESHWDGTFSIEQIKNTKNSKDYCSFINCLERNKFFNVRKSLIILSGIPISFKINTKFQYILLSKTNYEFIKTENKKHTHIDNYMFNQNKTKQLNNKHSTKYKYLKFTIQIFFVLIMLLFLLDSNNKSRLLKNANKDLINNIKQLNKESDDKIKSLNSEIIRLKKEKSKLEKENNLLDSNIERYQNDSPTAIKKDLEDYKQLNKDINSLLPLLKEIINIERFNLKENEANTINNLLKDFSQSSDNR